MKKPGLVDLTLLLILIANAQFFVPVKTQQDCVQSYQCGTGQCCLHVEIPSRFSMKTCQDLATSGQPCSAGKIQFQDSRLFTRYCPCAAGNCNSSWIHGICP